MDQGNEYLDIYRCIVHSEKQKNAERRIYVVPHFRVRMGSKGRMTQKEMTMKLLGKRKNRIINVDFPWLWAVWHFWPEHFSAIIRRVRDTEFFDTELPSRRDNPDGDNGTCYFHIVRRGTNTEAVHRIRINKPNAQIRDAVQFFIDSSYKLASVRHIALWTCAHEITIYQPHEKGMDFEELERKSRKIRNAINFGELAREVRDNNSR